MLYHRGQRPVNLLNPWYYLSYSSMSQYLIVSYAGAGWGTASPTIVRKVTITVQWDKLGP